MHLAPDPLITNLSPGGSSEAAAPSDWLGKTTGTAIHPASRRGRSAVVALMLKACRLGWCIARLRTGLGLAELGGDGTVGGGLVKKVERIMRTVKASPHDGLGLDVFELLVRIAVIVIGAIAVSTAVGTISLVLAFVGSA
jgi:hypothetical protein